MEKNKNLSLPLGGVGEGPDGPSGVIVNSRKTLALLIAEITKAEKQGEPVVLQVV